MTDARPAAGPAPDPVPVPVPVPVSVSVSVAASAAAAVPAAGGPVSGEPAPGPASAVAASASAGGRAVGIGLVLAGTFSQQFGAATAASLFPRLGASGVVSLRLTVAALFLLAVCRPRLRGYRRADWASVVAFGVALSGMNMLFYQAIARLPLGAAVTLEVLGPLVLSVVTARRASGWLWAALALAGVALLGHGGFHGLDPAGVAFILGAGVMWAAYILLSARTGSRFPKVDGLALAMTIGAVLSLPPAIADAGSDLLKPSSLGLGAAIALLSSVVPYTAEMLSLRRLPSSAFAVLMSLSPAVAALAGFLVLHQGLTPAEGLAVVLIVTASAGAVRAATTSTTRGRRSAGRPEGTAQ